MPDSDEAELTWGTPEQRRQPSNSEQAERKTDRRARSVKGSTASTPHDSEGQRRGGMTTKQRYGHEHFVEIGAKGGEIVRDKRGKEFYVEIGRRGGKSPKHHRQTSEGSNATRLNEHEPDMPA